MLKWKRSKDGTLTAQSGKSVFRITLSPAKGARVFPIYVLLRDTRYCYQASDEDGKAACKRVANLIAGNKQSLYNRIILRVAKKDKQSFQYQFKDCLGLHHVPEVDGPAKPFFRKHASKGLHPRWVVQDQTLLKRAGLSREELSDDYLDSLTVELWPLYRPFDVERLNRELKRNQAPPPSAKPPKEPPCLHPQSKKSPSCVYLGVAPEKRDLAQSRAISTVCTQYPLPFIPEDAKFSTLLKWAEKVRDYWEVRRKFATIEYLKYAVRFGCNWSFSRGDKAADRLAAIFKEEHKQWKSRLKAMIENTEGSGI